MSHSIRYHDTDYSDLYPDGDYQGRSLSDKMAELHRKKDIVSYNFYHISRGTKFMIEILQKELDK